ncbi:MAG: response regulator [Pseudomonadota bacterium]
MGEALQHCVENDVVVYLVDDDRGMVSATSQWLSLSGLKVRAFADPAALIKVLKPNQPCVVISDIRMPGIDGMELMKLIRAKDKTIPVILITGHGDIPLAVEAMKLGAFEFLQKPFSPEKLLDVTKQAQQQLLSAKAKPKDEIRAPNIVQVVSSETDTGDKTVLNGNLSDTVDEFEKELIESTLKKHRGAIPEVIKELEIPRRTLNAKMKKYGIMRSRFR